jgi:hypothetical protein
LKCAECYHEAWIPEGHEYQEGDLCYGHLNNWYIKREKKKKEELKDKEKVC